MSVSKYIHKERSNKTVFRRLKISKILKFKVYTKNDYVDPDVVGVEQKNDNGRTFIGDADQANLTMTKND